MKRILLSIAIFVLIVALCPVLSVLAEEQTTEEQAVQTVEVGIPIEDHPELFLTRSMPTHGEAKLAVFLIDFPDCKNENPIATKEYYEKTYFTGGVETNWGDDVSVASFYCEQSYGKLNISGRVFDWYTAEHERSYYDDRKAELIVEAAEHYRAEGVDFSEFDADGDGIIDGITYHFAGEYSDNRGDSWYNGVNYGVSGMIGDLQFTRIAQIYEGARDERSTMIEAICHELGHSLGMPDLYGEVYWGMEATLDLMSGNHNTINPYLKMMLGWIDEVNVVTGEVNDLRLDIYGDEMNGDYAIVTDSFDGLFDEFYLIAYREYAQYKTAVIWHIDARLNEDGTGFMNANLYYDPRPDKRTAHSIENPSPYLFIEEICANVDRNFVLNYPWTFEDSAFNPGTMLSPNNLPSSDWNGGVFSGIKIDDFKEHNDKYITFDVSFVEDKTAPFITTSEDELEFKDIVTLKFNETVYEGESWDGIKITDPDGNMLDASIVLPHYPHFEIEITFKADGYERGYQIYFPEGALCDSSGNKLEEKTLVASTDGILFPGEAEQIVGTNELIRNNSMATFFPYQDSFVVITDLWEGGIPKVYVEFMRLDYNGNVLKQSIVKNPFERSDIVNVIESGDGSYIFICRKESSSSIYNLLFCIDENGELKWINDSLKDTKISILTRDQYKNFYTDGGVVVYCQIKDGSHSSCLMYIDSETGETHTFEIPESKFDLTSCEFFHLYNGTALALTYDNDGTNNFIRLNIVDLESFDVIQYTELVHPVGTTMEIGLASVNDDGSLFVVYSLFSDALDRTLYATLFNSALFEVKTVTMREKSDFDGFYRSNVDGFFDVNRTGLENHGHSYLTVTRYDQYLNQVWKTDIIVNFTYFFKTPSNEILCYTSLLEPERECYIVSYGSEDEYLIPHAHSLTFVEAVEVSCTERGNLEHWYCTGCGSCFTDDSGAVTSDPASLFIESQGHKAERMADVESTCVIKGTVGGTKCAVCDKVIERPKIIGYSNRHDYVWKTAKEPTENEVGQEVKVCKDCGLTFETRPIEKLPSAENPDDNTIVIKPVDGNPADTPSTSTTSCGGAVGASACVVVVIIALGGAIAFKKKDF